MWKKDQTALVYPEDLSLIMTPHQNKNFQQIWNLIPSIYMHSNNCFKKHFLPGHWNDHFTSVSPLTSHPSCSSAINLILVQLLFFPYGVTNNYMHSPHFIILLSVMFPNLQSIALRANFKKGDQSVSSNRNTSTIQECCHPHENIHIWVEEKRQRQTATYVCKAMCICQKVRCRVVPGYHPQMVIFKANKSLVAICKWQIWAYTETGTANKNTQVPQ